MPAALPGLLSVALSAGFAVAFILPSARAAPGRDGREAVGRGTTFEGLFPRCSAGPAAARRPPPT